MDQFASAVPRFEPEKFFEGPVRSWGVIETRSGKPRGRVTGELNGVRDGAETVITQTLTFDGGRTQKRVWRIRRVDNRRYDASANDVLGPATGFVSGNAFHWTYTLELNPGKRLSRVRMEHWMYLLEDGTLLNRVVIRKFGVIVGQVTEHFARSPH